MGAGLPWRSVYPDGGSDGGERWMMAGHGGGRKGALVAAGLLGLALLAGTAGVRLLPGWLEGWAGAALRDAGFPAAGLRLQGVTLSGADASVTLRPDMPPARVSVRFSPGSLLRGRVERVEITGLHLGLTVDGRGIRPAGTPPAASDAPGGGGGLPDLPVDEIRLDGAVLDLATPLGATTVPLSALLTTRDGALALEGRAGIDMAGLAGTARVSLRRAEDGVLAADLTIDPPAAAERTGGLAGQGRILWQPGHLPSGSVSLSIRQARLPAIDQPFQADLTWTGDAARQKLLAMIQPDAGGSWQLAAQVQPRDTGEMVVSGGLDLLVPDLAAAGALLPGAPPLHGRLSGRITLPDWILASPPTFPDPALLPPLDIALRAEALAWTGHWQGGTLDVAGRLTRQPGAWHFTTDRPLTLEGTPGATVQALLPAPLGQGPAYLGLSPDGDGPLILAWDAAASRLDIGPARLGVELNGNALGGRIDRLALALPAPGAVLPTLSAALADGAFDAPAFQLAGRGIGLEVALDPAVPQPLAASLGADSIAHTGRPALLAPLAVTAAAEGDPAGELRFSAEGTAAAGALVLDVSGRQQAGGPGRASLTLHPLRFGPGGRTPADISPWLAAQAAEMTGVVGLKASYGWGPGAGPGRAELLLEDVGLTTDLLALQGLNGVVTAGSLSPPLLPAQTLSVALLDAGLPLTNGLIRFAVRPGRTLAVEQATFDWAGGTLLTTPFTLPLDRPAARFALEARGLNLARVLELAGVEGLEARGTLAGSIPVEIGENRIRFIEGELKAVEPGQIRYDPADPPAFMASQDSSTALLAQALRNLTYSELALGIDGEAGGEMAVTMRIRGANPDFYDGYPVALNLNLSGALGAILRSGLGAYRIPDTVRARIEEFRTQPPQP